MPVLDAPTRHTLAALADPEAAGALARAERALARLDAVAAKAAASPLAPWLWTAWGNRVLAQEGVAAAELEGYVTARVRVRALEAGDPLAPPGPGDRHALRTLAAARRLLGPRAPRTPTAGRVLALARRDDDLSAGLAPEPAPPPLTADTLEPWLSRMRAHSRELPATLAAAAAAEAWHGPHGPPAPPRGGVLQRLLTARACMPQGRPAPPLTPGFPDDTPWFGPSGERARWLTRFLAGIAAAAETHVRALHDVLRQRERVRAACADMRANALLPEAGTALLAHEALSPGGLQRALRQTRGAVSARAVARTVNTLLESGLAWEATGRRRRRVLVAFATPAADLGRPVHTPASEQPGAGTDAAPSPIQTPRAKLDTGALDAELTAIYENLERASARVETRLREG